MAALILFLSGKKLPYTFGLVDMALVIHALDKAGLPFGYDVVRLLELLRGLMSARHRD